MGLIRNETDEMSRKLYRYRVGSLSGEAPVLVYRYWEDGESEWILSPGAPTRELRRTRDDSPWEALRRLELLCRSSPATCVGYLAYELGVFQVMERRPRHRLGIPLMQMVVAGIAIDACRPLFSGSRQDKARQVDLGQGALPSFAEYERAIHRIIGYLEAGDVYEVNYTQRFFKDSPLSPELLYERLSTLNPAPHAAYLDCGEFQILSSSPERFLRMRDRHILTSPIKGTRPRHGNPEDDAQEAKTLFAGVKENAELLMICDLARHDLGKICETGSVRVDCLKELQSFATVHHLVSHVSGTLRAQVSHTEALRACFPGGSITGAPKRRAMEIIEALESDARGVYTGSIGYMRRNESGVFESEWNIAIRTLLYANGRVLFGSGGAITVDSTAALEYEELRLKAKALYGVLQNN